MNLFVQIYIVLSINKSNNFSKCTKGRQMYKNSFETKTASQL